MPVVSSTDMALEDEGRWAEYDYRRDQIVVSVLERPPAAQAEGLLHEILHGLFANAGIRQMAHWDKDIEETVVAALCPRICAFIADNPEAVRELQRMLK